MDFSNWLKETRDRAGLLQVDVAAAVGVSPQYFSDVERGFRAPFKDKELWKLAHALDVNPDVVYYRAGRVPPGLRDLNISPIALEQALAAFRDALKG